MRVLFVGATLAALGDGLIAKYGDRVCVNTNVRNHEVMGIVNEAIPKTDGAVLAYVPLIGNALAPDVERELNYICSNGNSRIRLAPMQLTDDGLVANVVEKMLIEDVTMPRTVA